MLTMELGEVREMPVVGLARHEPLPILRVERVWSGLGRVVLRVLRIGGMLWLALVRVMRLAGVWFVGRERHPRRRLRARLGGPSM